MTRRGRALAVAALVAAVAALWFASRYVALGREIAANRRALAGALEPRPGAAPEDASRRVARAVESNEALFDRTLRLAAARRTAGALALGGAALAVTFGAWSRRGAARDAGS